jgi:hypothetical protein
VRHQHHYGQVLHLRVQLEEAKALSAEPMLEPRLGVHLHLLFMLLGPALFWLAYPLGPFVAVAVAELSVHALRFATFRRLVFPAHRGYRVSLPRYVLSALPVSISGLIVVPLFRNRLDRTALTLTGAVIALVVGRR